LLKFLKKLTKINYIMNKKKSIIFLIILLFYSLGCNEHSKYKSSNNESLKLDDLIEFKQNLKKLSNNKKFKTIFFLDPECPMCISYSIYINDIYEKFKNNIDFIIIYPSKLNSMEKIKNFEKKYKLNIPSIVDSNLIITNYLDARITPECFLVDTSFKILYSGLINDWAKDLGKTGPITNKYLEKSIENILSSKKIDIKKTNAIGCIIQKDFY
tara:strand:+ start:185 stop:823 length:639 start_codon:yes stop_codon:yes gene_type:complete